MSGSSLASSPVVLSFLKTLGDFCFQMAEAGKGLLKNLNQKFRKITLLTFH